MSDNTAGSKGYTTTDNGQGIKVTDNATGQSATSSGHSASDYRAAVAKLEGKN